MAPQRTGSAVPATRDGPSDGGFVMQPGTGGHGYVNPRESIYRDMDRTALREIAALVAHARAVEVIRRGRRAD